MESHSSPLVIEKTEEYANGRMDIFRAYIGALNLEGHDEMGAVLPDGELAVHAALHAFRRLGAVLLI